VLALGVSAKPARPAGTGQAQADFQVLDMPADRRGADVELQLGRGHAAAVHHGLEHAQQAQVHVAELPQAAWLFTCINCN
jgi:hypothetical protein